MLRISINLIASLVVVLTLIACSAGEGEKFEDSLVFSIKANEISVELPKLQESSSEKVKPKEQQMIEYIKKSLNAGDSVSDNYLRERHPMLPEYYRNYLMEGQRQYIAGIEEGNPIKQIQGNNRIMEWSRFWTANKDAIIKK